MKKIILCFVLFLSLQGVRGQDRIITVQQDTISCKILSITSTHVNYEQKIGNKQVVGKFIPVEQVLEYYINTQSEVINRVDPYKVRLAHPWRIGLQAGGGYLLASSANAEKALQDQGISKSQAKDYYKRLKNGFQLSGDIHYLINEELGAGLKYSFFTSSADIDFFANTGDGINYVCMGESERIYVNYVGPSIFTQYWIGKSKKFRLTQELSFGYVHYRDEVKFDQDLYSSDNLLATGKTFGGTIELSCEYYPLSWLSVGANAGLFAATFKKLDVSNGYESATVDLDKNNYENMSRIDYSIGFRFHF
jgi:hypothetical protein